MGNPSPYHLNEMTAPAKPSRPARVLVVEDDPATRRFYSDVLQRAGLAIEQAHNGHQALEKALTSAPQLIITDIALPGMDGIELCRTLRADARTRDIPVLAITGHGDRQYPDRVRSAGADRVLTRPCDVDLLASKPFDSSATPTRHPPAENFDQLEGQHVSGRRDGVDALVANLEGAENHRARSRSAGQHATMMKSG